MSDAPEKLDHFVHKDPLSSAIFLTARFLDRDGSRHDANHVMDYCEALYTRLEALERRKMDRFGN